MFHAKFHSFSVMFHGKEDVTLTNFVDDSTTHKLLGRASLYTVVRNPLQKSFDA